MGYLITQLNGNLTQSYDQDSTIASDIALSCAVRKGSFFADPSFGLPELPKKITAQTIPLVRQRFAAALKWLLDTGKAKSIEILVEQDDDAGRLDVLITARQANDKIVEYETFVEVV